jgi:5-methyltetrahydrofolate--homocysteine methyltransferase
MIVVGERINATRKHIGQAVENKDAEFITKEVKEQEAAGANMIDVNAGKNPAKEIDDMRWLMNVVQDSTSLPLCLDSASPAVLEAALSLNKNGKPLVNSITDEEKRAEGMLPIIKKYDCSVVALLIDDNGIPDSIGRRIQILDSLVKKLQTNGTKIEDIYVDPCIFPISTDGKNCIEATEAIKQIKNKYSGIKTIIGLSNISFGLPVRSLINQAFLVLCIKAGLDAALIDPLDKKMISLMYAANALLNKDDYCMEYITAAREGKIS